MTLARARVVGVAVVAVTVAGLLAVALRGPARPSPSGSPEPDGSGDAAIGPTVFYELVDAEASRLFARTLDGRSLAREVASRRDVDAGPAWSVDPTGSLAVVLAELADNPDQQDLVAYGVGDGARRWTVRVPRTQPAWMSWAADGRLLAIATETDPHDRRQLLLVDAASGVSRAVELPTNVAIEGVDAEGAVILWQQLGEGGEEHVTFQFLRVDPVSLAVERLSTLPKVGPAGGGSVSVSASPGVAVDIAQADGEPGFQLRLHDLRPGGTTRKLASLPSADLVSIDPAGTGVIAAIDGSLRYVAFDGSASKVFDGGDATIGDLGWSADGAFLTVSTYPPNDLWVVERSSGRSVQLPLPRNADAHLVRMVGGAALPAEPLPSPEPGPTPTPAPSGGDVAGAPEILSSWLETSGGHRSVHAQRLIATDLGGTRVAATMPPIELGPAPTPDDGSTTVRLLPRPGSAEILVWVSSDGRSRAWLWDGAAGLRPAPLPSDWPAEAFNPAWRPDGRAIAASAGTNGLDGDFQGVFAIGGLGAKRTQVLPVVGEYTSLEGWWSQTELRVGHGVCTEGCTGTFSTSARLRIADRRLVQLTPPDRSHAAIDSPYADGNRLILSMINADPRDDLVLLWPEALGRPEDLNPLVPTDARALVVARSTETGTDLYRVDDIPGRAVDGVLASPDPVLLGTIAGRSLDVTLSPDGGWVVARNRIGEASLVRLSDGRAWPLGADRELTWAGSR